MIITSLYNRKIKDLIKLKKKKYRDLEGKFIVDTLNVIEEAYKAGLLLEIYLLEDTEELGFDVNTYYVNQAVMNKIKFVETSKFIGVVKKPKYGTLKGNKILLLDNIQDPGNLGTIIRSSLGFNVDTIILSLDSCDLYNEKTVRASEGSIFKMNIIKETIEDYLPNIKELNIPIYGTDVNNGIDVCEIKKDKYAIIMGNEGNGVKEEIRKQIEHNIYIKTNKELESLNVGVATSIILYELNK